MSRLVRKAPGAPLDRLSALLDRFRVRTSLFHSGVLCGRNTFEAQPGRAFLHVLRRGVMEVRHRRGETAAQRLLLAEPTLLFYPRPLHHEFINPPQDGTDFTCATIEFEGGDRNPIVQALPSLIHVPLGAVAGLGPAVTLLFSEADQLRCGSRAIADRMFEVVLIQLLRWILDHPEQAGVTRGLVNGLSDPRLAKALVALHRAPQEEWALDRMATLAGMSRSAFAKAFRLATDTTPAAYLTEWRLSLATSMLRGGRAVKTVATDTGFAGSASFSKAFRQRMGVSPRQWLASRE